MTTSEANFNTVKRNYQPMIAVRNALSLFHDVVTSLPAHLRAHDYKITQHWPFFLQNSELHFLEYAATLSDADLEKADREMGSYNPKKYVQTAQSQQRESLYSDSPPKTFTVDDNQLSNELKQTIWVSLIALALLSTYTQDYRGARPSTHLAWLSMRALPPLRFRYFVVWAMLARRQLRVRYRKPDTGNS